MKHLILLLVIASALGKANAQFIHKIKADSVLITNDSCTAELNLENSTKHIKGFLYNKGNGRTEFRKFIKLNDSAFIMGDDTLTIGGNIRGAGANGQVAYWTSPNMLSGNNNLFWDNSNARLGLGTASPIGRVDVMGGMSIFNRTSFHSIPPNGLRINAYPVILTMHPAGVWGIADIRCSNDGQGATLVLAHSRHADPAVPTPLIAKDVTGTISFQGVWPAGNYEEVGSIKCEIDSISGNVPYSTYGFYNQAINDVLRIGQDGRIGIGDPMANLNGSITAMVHIKGSNGSAGTAPIKLTPGTLLSTPESGTIEYNGDHLYVTINNTRHQLDRQTVTPHVPAVLLSDSATNVAQLDIVLSEAALGGRYRRIEIQIDDCLPATNNTELLMRFSSDNGASFNSGASDYEWISNWNISGAGAGSHGVNSQPSDSKISIVQNVGNSSAYSCNGSINLYHSFNSSKEPLYDGHFISNSSSSGLLIKSDVGGRRKTAQATNAIRLYFSAGNIAEIKYQVIGYPR